MKVINIVVNNTCCNPEKFLFFKLSNKTTLYKKQNKIMTVVCYMTVLHVYVYMSVD